MEWNLTRVAYYKDGKPVYYKEGSCDSSETKPTGDDAAYLTDGSILLESNTGKVCFYNKKSDSWPCHVKLPGDGT